MAVITRWSYKRGGRKAGFHCIGFEPPPPPPGREWIAPQKRAVLSSEWSHHIIIGLHLQALHLEKRNISSNLTLTGMKGSKCQEKQKLR